MEMQAHRPTTELHGARSRPRRSTTETHRSFRRMQSPCRWTNSMTVLDDLNKFVQDTRNASLFKTWAKSNPGEASKWNAYVDAVTGGNLSATKPALKTSYGN